MWWPCFFLQFGLTRSCIRPTINVFKGRGYVIKRTINVFKCQFESQKFWIWKIFRIRNVNLKRKLSRFLQVPTSTIFLSNGLNFHLELKKIERSRLEVEPKNNISKNCPFRKARYAIWLTSLRYTNLHNHSFAGTIFIISVILHLQWNFVIRSSIRHSASTSHRNIFRRNFAKNSPNRHRTRSNLTNYQCLCDLPISSTLSSWTVPFW